MVLILIQVTEIWHLLLLKVSCLYWLLIFRLPSDVKKVFHPIICCALSADLAAFAFGYFSKSGLDPVLGIHLKQYSWFWLNNVIKCNKLESEILTTCTKYLPDTKLAFWVSWLILIFPILFVPSFWMWYFHQCANSWFLFLPCNFI